ncbi:helix-turn-helix domain-containing protein [Streptomyces sp. NPDC048442]|uniref:peptidoglycan-binding protein n=1 Tax=Streptomyces sp. NPDC048442 TaxID=3154823 RepID=UPI0034329649
MSRWKTLPAELGERDCQLIVQLRRLKDHSGLSLAALEGRTTSSRSSWERYLNGRTPPPREAVEELARVCGSDPTRLLVLYDVAARDRDRGRTDGGTSEVGGAGEAGEAGEAVPQQDAGRRPRTLRVGPAVCGAAALALLVAFAAGYVLARTVSGDGSAPDTGAYTYAEGRTYPCVAGRKDGLRHAGHSVSRDALLMLNTQGRDVVEAQCLLRQHGFDPGVVDGLYGTRTKEAVEAFQRQQKQQRLVVDGLVGEDTWRELRR